MIVPLLVLSAAAVSFVSLGVRVLALFWGRVLVGISVLRVLLVVTFYHVAWVELHFLFRQFAFDWARVKTLLILILCRCDSIILLLVHDSTVAHAVSSAHAIGYLLLVLSFNRLLHILRTAICTFSAALSIGSSGDVMGGHHGCWVEALTTLLINIRSQLLTIGIVAGSLPPMMAFVAGIAVISILRSKLRLPGTSMRRLLPLNLDLCTCFLRRAMLNRWWLEIFVCRIGRVVVLPSVRIVLRIVQDYVGREAFDDPLMLEAFVGREAFLWVPLEASTDEIHKRLVWHLSEFVHDVSEPLLLLIVREHFKWSRHCIILELRE